MTALVGPLPGVGEPRKRERGKLNAAPDGRRDIVNLMLAGQGTFIAVPAGTARDLNDGGGTAGG